MVVGPCAVVAALVPPVPGVYAAHRGCHHRSATISYMFCSLSAILNSVRSIKGPGDRRYMSNLTKSILPELFLHFVR